MNGIARPATVAIDFDTVGLTFPSRDGRAGRCA